MADLNIDSMNIAPGVVETIVSLAASDVEGVVSVGDSPTTGLRALVGAKPSTQGVEVEAEEDGKLHITVSLNVQNGNVLPDLAADVRRAVADAVSTQVGATISAVDVFIDGIQFAS